ncbi:MAG: hypothetical protein SNJ74_08295 [Fimbriimonadaceae bacterium]
MNLVSMEQDPMTLELEIEFSPFGGEPTVALVRGWAYDEDSATVFSVEAEAWPDHWSVACLEDFLDELASRGLEATWDPKIGRHVETVLAGVRRDRGF